MTLPWRAAAAAGLALSLLIGPMSGPLHGEDGAVLSAPQWVSINEFRGSINLRWFRVQGAVSYAVLRRTGQEGAFLEIGRTDNPVFDDFQVQVGTTYFYRIIPYNKAGAEGSPSQDRPIRLEQPELVELKPPQWSIARINKDGIALSWLHDNPSNVLAYNLYRREKDSDSFNLVTSSLDTTYLDRGLSKGRTYSYVVTALSKQLQESDYSPIKKVEFSPPTAAVAKRSPYSAIRTLEEVLVLAEEVRSYTWHEYGFVSPVDVDFLPSNQTLYVSDSGTRRITVIDSRGQVAGQMGGKGAEPGQFDSLLGIALDNRGNCYAVDSYRGEIVLFDSRYQFVERITLRDKVESYFGKGFALRFPAFRFGLTDLWFGPNGSLIVVDNPNGWLYVLDRSYNLARVIGEKGEGAGLFHYPTFLAMDWQNRIVVSDTMNSRVQVVETTGEPQNVIGERGLGIGQFIRPKGLALDPKGNLYVGDSFLNAIQVFTLQGDYVGLLASQESLPLDLGLVGGMTFVAPDLLYFAGKISRSVHVLRVPVARLRTTVAVAGAAAAEPMKPPAKHEAEPASPTDPSVRLLEEIRALGQKDGSLRITLPLFTPNASAPLPSAAPVFAEISGLAARKDVDLLVEILAISTVDKLPSTRLGQERLVVLRNVLKNAANPVGFVVVSNPPKPEGRDRVDLIVKRRGR